MTKKIKPGDQQACDVQTRQTGGVRREMWNGGLDGEEMGSVVMAGKNGRGMMRPSQGGPMEQKQARGGGY